MNKNKKQINDDKSITFYKTRVLELETEVSKLKQRLTDLRKAKNNVVIKREREFVHVGHPPINKSSTSRTSEDNRERKTYVTEKEKVLSNRVKELMNQKVLLNEDLANERMKGEGFKKSLDDLLERLELKSTQQESKQVENKVRQVYINDLMTENADLRSQNEKLVNDLSVKEAVWLNKEENFIQKGNEMQAKWSEKYAKWMVETERKMEELKQQNLMLRDCLNRGIPRHKNTNENQELNRLFSRVHRQVKKWTNQSFELQRKFYEKVKRKSQQTDRGTSSLLINSRL